ncbi:hypothetical protein BN874_840002 [Candidatus Contendobacter odensis Run_B_J11]|uniref:Uncharacterized protein n=1 Tax=Candidatus Contendobacter odensis Run_B_J11 TaxID=1400861 RepID=A0A7U7GG72_9GAMM|nr:hypothetical protein BN874_840002 [Candidatus Contendobacter odensis Run_B_J11]
MNPINALYSSNSLDYKKYTFNDQSPRSGESDTVHVATGDRATISPEALLLATTPSSLTEAESTRLHDSTWSTYNPRSLRSTR